MIDFNPFPSPSDPQPPPSEPRPFTPAEAFWAGVTIGFMLAVVIGLVAIRLLAHA